MKKKSKTVTPMNISIHAPNKEIAELGKKVVDVALNLEECTISQSNIEDIKHEAASHMLDAVYEMRKKYNERAIEYVLLHSFSIIDIEHLVDMYTDIYKKEKPQPKPEPKAVKKKNKKDT